MPRVVFNAVSLPTLLTSLSLIFYSNSACFPSLQRLKASIDDRINLKKRRKNRK